MKRILTFALLAVAVILVAGCGTGRDSDAYAQEQAAVVDFDDCVALQARFDGWYDNRGDFAPGVASSSMQADFDRMHAIGC